LRSNFTIIDRILFIIVLHFCFLFIVEKGRREIHTRTWYQLMNPVDQLLYSLIVILLPFRVESEFGISDVAGKYEPGALGRMLDILGLKPGLFNPGLTPARWPQGFG
jgi:hypothetical protein